MTSRRPPTGQEAIRSVETAVAAEIRDHSRIAENSWAEEVLKVITMLLRSPSPPGSLSDAGKTAPFRASCVALVVTSDWSRTAGTYPCP
jgi:hypothetical protein